MNGLGGDADGAHFAAGAVAREVSFQSDEETKAEAGVGVNLAEQFFFHEK